jgi:hypothetical protein
LLVYVFQLQVLSQCNFFLIAAQDYDAWRARSELTASTDLGPVWFGIQSMVTAAANISKALWGQGGKLAEQRKVLRDSIGVDESSPLNDLRMRNHFEHFDERLDRWWQESERHNYSDANVGPAAVVETIPGDGIDVFRRFDPETGELRFWGDTVDLSAIPAEVRRIQPILRDAITSFPECAS